MGGLSTKANDEDSVDKSEDDESEDGDSVVKSEAFAGSACVSGLLIGRRKWDFRWNLGWDFGWNFSSHSIENLDCRCVF